MPLDTQWGFLTLTATTPLVSSYHAFAVVTRNHQWICRSHSANPPSCLSHLCQGWIWRSVPAVMQKNMGRVDKTAFFWAYHPWTFRITATELHGAVSICCTHYHPTFVTFPWAFEGRCSGTWASNQGCFGLVCMDDWPGNSHSCCLSSRVPFSCASSSSKCFKHILRLKDEN